MDDLGITLYFLHAALMTQFKNWYLTIPFDGFNEPKSLSPELVSLVMIGPFSRPKELLLESSSTKFGKFTNNSQNLASLTHHTPLTFVYEE